MLTGVFEDQLRQPTLVAARANMNIVRALGFNAVRVTALWSPGQTAPPARELAALRNVAGAAQLSAIRVFVGVQNAGSATTPLTEEQRSEFARYAAAIARSVPYFRTFLVGNEPNINRFWMPQYNPDGSDAAAPAYLELLTETYDALKAVSRRITVVGGVLSPRGQDVYPSPRHTHSPVTFIRDMGLAYRDSERTTPFMDAFAIHPYQDNSSQPPTYRRAADRRIRLNDYDKLVRVLGEAFDGTPQRGSTIPIYYTEWAAEAQIPASKVRLYTGIEPSTTRPVSDATHAAYYRLALQVAYCQPTVQGIFLLHLWDERDRNRWQSGLYYVDRRPRVTAAAVRRGIQESRRGILARCPGLALPIRLSTRFVPAQQMARAKQLSFRLICNFDCAYTASVERLPKRTPVLTATGTVVARKLTTVKFPRRALQPGTYRVALTAAAAVNPGRSVSRYSVRFRIAKKEAEKPARPPR